METSLTLLIKQLEDSINDDATGEICECGETIIDVDLLIDIKTFLDKLQSFIDKIQT